MKDNITFEIKDQDYKNYLKFKKQHKNCFKGMTGEQFRFSFVPGSLGICSSVECSCGRSMNFGGFIDTKSREYDEEKYSVLTEQDRANEKFEKGVETILSLKNPRIFRIAFKKDQDFDLIYTYSVGVAVFADERISKCILYKERIDEMHSIKPNYTSSDNAENITKFYDHFEKRVKEEIANYNCKNEKLLNL